MQELKTFIFWIHQNWLEMQKSLLQTEMVQCKVLKVVFVFISSQQKYFEKWLLLKTMK